MKRRRNSSKYSQNDADLFKDAGGDLGKKEIIKEDKKTRENQTG